MENIEYSQSVYPSKSRLDSEGTQIFQQNDMKEAITNWKYVRSFSHPEINFISSFEYRPAFSIGKHNEIENISIPQLYDWFSNRSYTSKIDISQQCNKKNAQMSDMNIKVTRSIDKAKEFFVKSGILGPLNLSKSCDLIKKTSRIHIDHGLKSQIRKTSMCLRYKNVREEYTPQLKENFEDSNDLQLNNMRMQIYNLRAIIESGESKIIMLRAEVNKMRSVLQEIIYAHSPIRKQISAEIPNLCDFCVKY
ncbi:uncharacterized protein LOC132794865 isoform X1 [Drosophila nasuta]|uniref:uncharacterized protein LOC132794865 isoform X1 n=1 Tax=Drosophila nasuta TaxID=42062 RepID=UPI00295F1B78|nr:uncharacterized protein LOC132794865 isoform X1 [Drosophila nasuta]XP_060661120.1 uncharacterized protein LOC132794865 isoform X1 [Drosophila nasuta]